MLQADNVSFAYGRSKVHARSLFALRDVSLSVDAGDLVGILGPNGSGKTTLLRVIGGMLPPSSGSVSLDGRALAAWARRDIARRIAFVPQETHPSFDFTVLDIVLMGRFPHLSPFALEGPPDLAIARQALEATGTARFEARPFSTLSGGEKQRVIIASALAQAAAVLLLDEPTASLDLGYQFEIASLLRQLNRDRHTAMVVSTHDLNLAASLCRRVVLVKHGRVLAEGPTEHVLTASNIRELYGVDVDVHFHERAGHLTVVPVGRTA